MLKKWWFVLGGCAATVATVFVFAGIGGAASPSICMKPSDVNASCVREFVSPHFISKASLSDPPSKWSQAISSTKFTNESGLGGSTATHVAISVTWPVASSAVTVISTRLFANGTEIANPGSVCTSTSTSTTTTRACAVGNIPGGNTAKLIVRFATNTSMNPITGTATFGESGNDNPNGPNGTVNDKDSSRDSLTVASGSFQGSCFDLGLNQQATVFGSTAMQMTTAIVGQAASSSLPCTPADAGVDATAPKPVPDFTQQEAVVEFPSLSGGPFVNVVLNYFNTLPKTFVLWELKTDPTLDPTSLSSWTQVPNCAVGMTWDSCIAYQHGREYGLHVLGSDLDAKYNG